MDFDEPVLIFEDAYELYVKLRQSGHIFLYTPSDDRYKAAANDCKADSINKSLYIETSVSAEGVFVESEDFWIANYMFDEFYSPEHRPYIEPYLS